MKNLPNLKIISLIARIGKSVRPELAQKLKISEANRWILVSMGGVNFQIALERWGQIPRLNWIVLAAIYIEWEEIRSFAAVNIPFADVLASVDTVDTKTGYGIFSEAVYSGIQFCI